MPRKGPAPKRPLVNDPVYGSQLVTQLVNKVLLDGKKSLAERIVYGALEQARDKTGTDPVVTLKRAMDNVKPALEVRSRRVGGATYQVPGRGASGTLGDAGTALVGQLFQATPGEDHDRAPGERDLGRQQWPGCRRQATRGHPQDGRGQPRLRALSLVISRPGGDISDDAGRNDSELTTQSKEWEDFCGTEGRADRPDQGPQYRHHGAHRRRQDHDDRAHPLLHRYQLQDR